MDREPGLGLFISELDISRDSAYNLAWPWTYLYAS